MTEFDRKSAEKPLDERSMLEFLVRLKLPLRILFCHVLPWSLPIAIGGSWWVRSILIQIPQRPPAVHRDQA